LKRSIVAVQAYLARPIGKLRSISSLRLGKSQTSSVPKDELEPPTYGFEKVSGSTVLAPIQTFDPLAEATQQAALRLKREGMKADARAALEPWVLEHVSRTSQPSRENDVLGVLPDNMEGWDSDERFDSSVSLIRKDSGFLYHLPVTEPVMIPDSKEEEPAKARAMRLEDVDSRGLRIHIPVTEPLNFHGGEKWW